MLGKLIKNSFKANASAVYINYLAMGVIAVIMLILMFVDWTKWGDRGVGVGMAIKVAAAGLLCLTAFVSMVLTFVAVFGEFRRSMYRSEGQLTLTLPVRSSTLLFAIWLSGSFWVILSYTALYLCIFGSMLYLIRHSLGVIEGDADYYSIYTLVTEMIRQLADAAGINAPNINVVLNLAGVYAIKGGVSACVFVMIVFFAVTVSYCRPFNKHNSLNAVLFFFITTFVSITVAKIMQNLFTVYIVVSQDAFTFVTSKEEVKAAWMNGYGAASFTDMFVTALFGVGVYLFTVHLIDTKVNVSD